jgi:hypothetical protein
MNTKKLISLVGIAAVFGILSVDGVLINWKPLGSAGSVAQELLKAFAVSVLTGGVIWSFVEKESSTALMKLLDSPESFFGRVGASEFPSYVSKFVERVYQIEGRATLAIWNLLREHLFSPQEYRENLDTTIVLTGEVDADGYRKLAITSEYTIHCTDKKNLRFCCRFSGNRDSIMHDKDYDLSWSFLPTPSAKSLPPLAFVVQEVRINDKPIKCSMLSAANDLNAIEFLAESGLESLDGAKVWFRFEVLQSMVYGYVSYGVKRLSKDVTVRLNYAGAPDVDHVASFPHFFAQNSIRDNIIDAPKSNTVHADGWVFPKGAAVFSWSSPARTTQATS